LQQKSLYKTYAERLHSASIKKAFSYQPFENLRALSNVEGLSALSLLPSVSMTFADG